MFIVFCLKEKLIVNGCCQQVYFVVLFNTSIFCSFEDCMDVTFFIPLCVLLGLYF